MSRPLPSYRCRLRENVRLGERIGDVGADATLEHREDDKSHEHGTHGDHSNELEARRIAPVEEQVCAVY